MQLFIQTTLGILALIGGVVFMYFFVSGLNNGFNILFFLLSLVCLSGAGFLFFRVSKIANGIPTDTTKATETGSKLLEKNNQIVKDWSKATSKQDNLKAVQVTVAAEATTIAEGNK